MKDIFYKGRIYDGCIKKTPQHRQTFNVDLIDEISIYTEQFERHLQKLASYPVSGKHDFKDYQDVTGLYEIEHTILGDDRERIHIYIAIQKNKLS